jgi:hypothetical protein
MYSGAKLLSTSTPSLLLGKSLRCPTDAMTTKSLPMNFLRVFTLVGDSTIRRDLFLAPRIDLVLDLVLDLAFNFILVFGSSLTFGLTIVLATTSPNALSLVIIIILCAAIELIYPHYTLIDTYPKLRLFL